jgi:hypothetical protein
MPNFNLENYETVEERLAKYWKDHPNGRIWTEVVQISDDGSIVTIKALVYKDIEDVNPVATGIAQETQGQGGFANKDAWMENCETSAIGRALANWKYQGSNKPRPSRQEMSKVSDKPAAKAAAPKKKDTAPEKVTSPSNELKQIILDMCNGDKDFAANVWKVTTARMDVKKEMPKDVAEYTDDNQKVFIDVAAKYIDKQKKTFEERQGNSEAINNVIETFDDVEIKEGEEDMANIPDGEWQGQEMSDAQKNFLSSLIDQAIDDGKDQLAAEAKTFMNSGNATKGKASEWIEKLKS